MYVELDKNVVKLKIEKQNLLIFYFDSFRAYKNKLKMVLSFIYKSLMDLSTISS